VRALRTLLLGSLLVAALRPTLAHADAPPAPPTSGECVTTTTTTVTTRCTGDAAPLAVPPPAAPAQPPPVAAPPPPTAVPGQLPPWYVAPQAPSLAPHAHAHVPGHPPVVVQVNGRTRVVVDPDGSMWQETTRSTANAGGVGAGLTLFLGSWFVTGIAGTARGNAWGWWPVFGAYTGAAWERDESVRVGWVLSGIIQTAGFVTSLICAAAGPKKVERLPLRVGPMGVSGSF
jgi:hypothetical protein